MNANNDPGNALGATNMSCIDNDSDEATRTRQGAATAAVVANQMAHLAMAGHAVHKLADGGYLVCKYGYTHHASDFAALQRFARRLGVSNE